MGKNPLKLSGLAENESKMQNTHNSAPTLMSRSLIVFMCLMSQGLG